MILPILVKGTRHDGCQGVFAGFPDDDPRHYCENPAQWHVIWTPLQGSLVCDDCLEGILEDYVFFARHRFHPICHAEGARYFDALGCCGIEVEAI